MALLTLFPKLCINKKTLRRSSDLSRFFSPSQLHVGDSGLMKKNSAQADRITAAGTVSELHRFPLQFFFKCT